MSGIVGLINASGAPVDAALLESMTAYMDFRGPDAHRTWSDGPVGLGHTLLITTFEHARERQPATLDGQVWITADARIDGRDVLKAELEAAGRTGVKEATDCDLILHAYHAWGEDCVAHLIGDFAFAIWDGRTRTLFCVRDHFGVKPFYYAQPGGEFVFSNTLKAVRLHPSLTATLNDQFVVDFLLFGFNQDVATTAFVDIQRLPPAHSLTWRDGSVTIRRYWSIPIEELVHYKRPEEYVERFLEVFKLAVADRLRTDSVGIYMSGGMDSSAIAAIAKAQMEAGGQLYDLRAYTTVNDNVPSDQERHWSRKVSEFCGIPIQYHIADDCLPFVNCSSYAPWLPEPLHAPYIAFQCERVRQVAAAHRVVLSGQGGDPVFYPSRSYLGGLLSRAQVGALAAILWRYWRKHRRLPPLYLRSWFRERLTTATSDAPVPSWLSSRLRSIAESRARLGDARAATISRHPLHTEAVGLLQQPAWPHSFEVDDPGVTRQPIEARAPYFDVRLIGYVLQVPPVPWCLNKELLRQAMKELLPKEVRLRPKTPWGGDSTLFVPLADAIRTASRELAWDRMSRYVDTNAYLAAASAVCAEHGTVLHAIARPLSLKHWLSHLVVPDMGIQTVIDEAPAKAYI